MKWRFWRKDNTPAQFDLHTLAYVTVELMVKREPPFNQWRPDGFEVPENVETVEWFVNIYQLAVFLDSVERKYGSDVAAVMKTHLTEIMNNGSIRGRVDSFFDAVRDGRKTLQREPFFSDNPSIQVDINVARSFLRLLDEPEREKESLFLVLAKALTFGRISAESSFDVMINAFQITPLSIIGLSTPDKIPIQWSDSCGCFERQLQRRYQNALFPSAKRIITNAELVEARTKDLADISQLEAGLKEIVGELQNLPDHSPDSVGFDELYRFREAVEQLIIRCAAVGTIANSQREGFQWVYDTLVTIMRRACPPEQRAQLDAAIVNSGSLQKTWANQFVAQFNRKDTPISPDDLLPSLLVEDLETVRLMASLMPEENRKGLGKAAVYLVEDAKKEGYIVPQSAEKLQALH